MDKSCQGTEKQLEWPISLLFIHFTADCFISEGVRFRDDLGMPTAKRLKPDAVPTLFARSIDYLGSTSSASTAKSHAARPLSEKREEKRQQESVYIICTYTYSYKLAI